MDDFRCANCSHWKRSIKGQKSGWCRAWHPAEYQQKRGRGSSKFLNCSRGVITDDDQWCGRWHGKRDGGGE